MIGGGGGVEVLMGGMSLWVVPSSYMFLYFIGDGGGWLKLYANNKLGA